MSENLFRTGLFLVAFIGIAVAIFLLIEST